MRADWLPDDVLRATDMLADVGIAAAIGDADRDGFPLVHVNAAFQAMTGYPAEEILDRKCSFLQDEETEPEAIAALRQALRDGEAVRVTLSNRRRDGSHFYNEVRMLAPREIAGRRYVIAVQTDVTESAAGVRRLENLINAQQAELDELRVLQAALTPPAVLEVPHLDVASAFAPAEEGVAGDFFLVTPGPAGSITAVVGDVVGHGLQAARRASFVRASLATFAAFTPDPQRLLELANYSLIERMGEDVEFVTAACANFGADGVVDVALAGHPPPRWLDDAVPVDIPTGGLPLGIDLETRARRGRVHLEPGRGLLFFTDGLPEAQRARNDPAGADGGSRDRFGEERVERILRELAGGTPASTVERLSQAVEDFVLGQRADDLCLLAVRSAEPSHS